MDYHNIVIPSGPEAAHKVGHPSHTRVVNRLYTSGSRGAGRFFFFMSLFIYIFHHWETRKNVTEVGERVCTAPLAYLTPTPSAS